MQATAPKTYASIVTAAAPSATASQPSQDQAAEARRRLNAEIVVSALANLAKLHPPVALLSSAGNSSILATSVRDPGTGAVALLQGISAGSDVGDATTAKSADDDAKTTRSGFASASSRSSDTFGAAQALGPSRNGTATTHDVHAAYASHGAGAIS